MEFKFYKGNVEKEPLKTIHEDWLKARETRNEKLKVIFDTIPFYDGWFGSESNIEGIVCKDDENVLSEIGKTKGYKVEIANKRTVVKPDRRYKVGKELNAKLTQCWQILKENPDFFNIQFEKIEDLYNDTRRDKFILFCGRYCSRSLYCKNSSPK